MNELDKFCPPPKTHGNSSAGRTREVLHVDAGMHYSK